MTAKYDLRLGLLTECFILVESAMFALKSCTLRTVHFVPILSTFSSSTYQIMYVETSHFQFQHFQRSVVRKSFNGKVTSKIDFSDFFAHFMLPLLTLKLEV